MTKSGRYVRAAVLLLAVAIAGPAFGDADERSRRDAPDREDPWDFQALVSVEEGYIDNVRADSVNRDGAWYTTFGAESWWRRRRRGWLPHWYGGLVRGRVYSEYPNRNFAQFGPSLGWEWKRLLLTLDYRYSPETLRVDPDATADAFAEVHNLYGELRSRFGHNKRWTVLFTTQSDWEYFDPAYEDRTHFEETVEAGVRCRASERVSVRTGVLYALRESRSENFDRDQVTALFGFDLFLPAGMRALLRYERTWRNFLVGFPTDAAGDRNRNFGREDDVNAFEAGLDVPAPWIEDVIVQLRYHHRDNGSTRPDRDYRSNEGSMRLVYEYD